MYVHMRQKKKSVIWSSIFMTLRLKLLYHIIRLLYTGKSLSEALLFAEQGENMLCTKIVLNVRNNFCDHSMIL